MQDTSKVYMTRREAADRYGVTERTIDRWRNEGVIPADAVRRVGIDERGVRLNIVMMDEIVGKLDDQEA